MRSKLTGRLNNLGVFLMAFVASWGLVFCIGAIMAATWYFTRKGAW